MFNSIRGTITGKTGDTLFILTNGIEWDISVPASDMGKLSPPGEETTVYTWLYHREDQMKLFGFLDPNQRATFLELLKVEGIGPKGALKILSNIDQESLEQALETEDLARLSAVPGLGKKTAQKMILSLKGKLVSPSALPETPYGELVEALAGMGYDKRIAAEAISRVEKNIDPSIKGAEREKLLFKDAIVYLSGQ